MSGQSEIIHPENLTAETYDVDLLIVMKKGSIETIASNQVLKVAVLDLFDDSNIPYVTVHEAAPMSKELMAQAVEGGMNLYKLALEQGITKPREQKDGEENKHEND